MKKIKKFNYERVQSFEEAGELLKCNEDACPIAGGTDLLGTLKTEILCENPGTLVDLKSIQGSKGIKASEKEIEIGALTTLTEIEESESIRKKAPMIAEAAHSIATPLVRNMGTIGGNLCQDVRCWFYRYPHEGGGRMVCRRKGGDICYALQGDNRNHSIFGGVRMGTTPCRHACPAGTNIPEYMEQIRYGNFAGAAQILMQVNPMPAVTSRVCAHFCQDECSHGCGSSGESVSIRNVERYVGDYILEHADEFYQAPSVSTGKKVAVIGSGPSGLSAAFFLRKAGNEVTVYDSREEPGGMLMYAIPEYRLPKDKVRTLIHAYKGMGVEFRCNTRVGEDVKPAELEEKYDSVYYATGTWKRPVLGLAGEELTVFGLDFLVEVEKWMDGKVGREVLVTGGGNVAMDVAITAKRLGAKRVVLACLESESEMPASKAEIARAREEGIEIMPGWGLSKVVENNGAVKGMELVRCTSVRDETGRFNPQYAQSDKKVVEAENILMAVGQKVDLSFLDEKYQLELNKRGLIDVAEETMMTSRKGIFAGGDATTGPSTVIQCIANGHKAANGINSYLEVSMDHECVGKQIKLPFLTFDTKGIQEKTGLKLSELPAAQRDLVHEDETATTREEAIKEAARCMNCGCYAVHPSDMAPALIAADAVIRTNQRELSAADFCCGNTKPSVVLNRGEVITGISVPVAEGAIMHYDKFRVRESVDFALVGLASVFGVENGEIRRSKLILGGVAPIPVRLNEVEAFLAGKKITKEIADEAGEIAVKHVTRMSRNEYKINVIKGMLETAIMRLACS